MGLLSFVSFVSLRALRVPVSCRASDPDYLFVLVSAAVALSALFG